jgi:transcriptional regulator with XRE-family HTH domain
MSITINTEVIRLLNMSLQKRILNAMEKAGLKQIELARLAGVSRATVSLWVSGKTMSISGDSLTRVARVLNEDAHWLSTGERRQDMASYHVAETTVNYGSKEQRLLQLFRALSEEDQARALGVLNALAKTAAALARQ